MVDCRGGGYQYGQRLKINALGDFKREPELAISLRAILPTTCVASYDSYHKQEVEETLLEGTQSVTRVMLRGASYECRKKLIATTGVGGFVFLVVIGDRLERLRSLETIHDFDRRLPPARRTSSRISSRLRISHLGSSFG